MIGRSHGDSPTVSLMRPSRHGVQLAVGVGVEMHPSEVQVTVHLALWQLVIWWMR